MSKSFRDYWCCPDEIAASLPERPAALSSTREHVAARMPDAELPADLDGLVTALRREEYLDNDLTAASSGLGPAALIRRAYYLLRPLLPVAVRKHAQRLALKGWQKRPYPAWPVDTTVDDLMLACWREILDQRDQEPVPFIWFWPHGASSCAIMTHDVETGEGRDTSDDLMAMEHERGLHSSFEVVPEVRYEVPDAYLQSIRDGGCEVCLHGLNHDGHLFTERAEFERRNARITEHGRRFGAAGFRSPVMYRNLEWIDELPISYDMSVPNVGHLDPQPGGCCTVMPYFLGRVLELPLTTTQDYPLQNILRHWSMDLWRQQMEIIRARHGLMSFIIHPDYTIEARARELYGELLDELKRQRDEHGVWTPLPGEVDQWWRRRQAMRLVHDGGGWRIEGDEQQEAVIAWATTADGEVRLERPQA